MQETVVRSLDWEDSLAKGMASYSNNFAWRIPGTAEPGGLPSLGLHRVGHDWSDLAAAAGHLRCSLYKEIPCNFSWNVIIWYRALKANCGCILLGLLGSCCLEKNSWYCPLFDIVTNGIVTESKLLVLLRQLANKFRHELLGKRIVILIFRALAGGEDRGLLSQRNILTELEFRLLYTKKGGSKVKHFLV